MASIKVILSTNKIYADGSHPIVFQIIDNRKTFKKVIHKCLPKFWDSSQARVKSVSPNAFEINKLINSKLSFYEKAILLANEEDREISSKIFEENSSVSLVDGLELEISKLEASKKFATSTQYDIIKTQVKDFKDIRLDRIDKDWIDGFANFLRLSKANSGYTINKKISRIKSTIRKYGKKNINAEVNEYKKSSVEQIKAKLDREELDKIINLTLPTNDIIEAVRDFFVLQVYLRGVRVGDLLQATSEDFKDDRFVYRSFKTNTNYDLSLILPARVIVLKYSARKYQKLFPFWKFTSNSKKSADDNEKARTKHKESCTTVINKYLKILAEMAGISKNLSTHIARHSFAVLADESTGGNMAIIQQLLGHSKRSTTEGYIKNLRKVDMLDKAADDIFKDIL
ncbi:integrase/recombinase XerD [Pedobacter sp. UYEF25]